MCKGTFFCKMYPENMHIRKDECRMKIQSHEEFDVILVGGGISGLAVAYGLCKKNPQLRIAVLDAPTEVNKASRTNVGLIWCQSKFLHEPKYAAWAFRSAALFPALLQELEEVSGIKVPVNFTGGLIPVLGEAEYSKREQYIHKLKSALSVYRGHMLNRSELEKKLPKISFGPEVSGAAWCEDDGVVEPLLLFRAYRKALQCLGVTVFEDVSVFEVQAQNAAKKAYTVITSKGDFRAERVVLAAGLANRRLAHFALSEEQGGRTQKDVKSLPIFADKGQVLLTERMPFVMPIPVLGCTQTFGGTVIIGFKHETRGHDATVDPCAVSQEGVWALRVWPELGKKRIIRSWPGLRVMPDDNVAIYSHLPGHPQVTVVNTHSAVTLSAVHSVDLADYVLGGALPAMAQNMTLQRFGFQC